MQTSEYCEPDLFKQKNEFIISCEDNLMEDGEALPSQNVF